MCNCDNEKCRWQVPLRRLSGLDNVTPPSITLEFYATRVKCIQGEAQLLAQSRARQYAATFALSTVKTIHRLSIVYWGCIES